MAVSTPNLHALYHSHLPLGVECSCGRRALVDAAKVGARDGNMKEMRFLKLRCQGCQSREPKELRIFSAQGEVDAFLVGGDGPGPRF